MRNKKIMIAVAVLILVASTIIVLISSSLHSSQNKIYGIVDRLSMVVNEDWHKQSVTQVSQRVYSNDAGNTIILYTCQTTYYDTTSADATTLNTNAIAAVVAFGSIVSYRDCIVNDFPTTLCQKDGLAYLCWTISPEISCVIAYDPAINSEEEIFHIAENIKINTNS